MSGAKNQDIPTFSPPKEDNSKEAKHFCFCLSPSYGQAWKILAWKVFESVLEHATWQGRMEVSSHPWLSSLS